MRPPLAEPFGLSWSLMQMTADHTMPTLALGAAAKSFTEATFLVYSSPAKRRKASTFVTKLDWDPATLGTGGKSMSTILQSGSTAAAIIDHTRQARWYCCRVIRWPAFPHPRRLALQIGEFFL